MATENFVLVRVLIQDSLEAARWSAAYYIVFTVT